MCALKRPRRCLMLLVAALFLLAACAGEDPVTSPTAAEAPPGPADAPDAVSTPTTAATGDGTFDAVYAELEALSGGDRTARLVELATENGAMTLYTANSDSSVAAEAFQEQYGIPVQIYRAGASTVLQRITQEIDAGGVEGDVAELNAQELLVLDDEDALVEYTGPAGEDFPEIAIYEGWTSHWAAALVPAWNTEAVPAGEEPGSYEELAGDQWAGRLILERDAWEWYMTLRQHFLDQGMSEADADALFEAMATNATTADGYLTLNQLLTAGEAAVAPADYVHLVRRSSGEGAPVAWEPPVSPGVLIQAGVGLLQGAGNPAGALLYYEWLLGEGQAIYEELGRSPTSTELAGSGEAGNALGGIELLVPDPDQLLNSSTEWQDRYAALFQ